MFAGCLKISQYRVTLPRPGQALSWHLRPADRRVTTTGYCYNLQSSIPRTIAVLWCPASSLTVIKARLKDLEWRGDTGKLGSPQSRRQEFLCFNSPVNCTDGRDFLISTDARLLSLIGHLLGLKAPNSWIIWDDQVILTLCHLEPVCWINQRSAIQQGLAPLCSPLTACWLSLGIY